MAVDPIKNGLEACKLLRKTLERAQVSGKKQVSEAILSFQFVDSLEKAYLDEQKKPETKDQ